MSHQQFTAEEYKLIGLYVLTHWGGTANFAETDSTKIADPQLLLQLRDILQSQYQDGITAIPEARLNSDDSFSGIFEDEVNPKLIKRFNFTISADDTIAYKLLNPADVENFTEELEFAAAAAKKKKKNCTKGINCGGSCIAATKTCRKAVDAGTKKKTAELRKKVKGGGAAGKTSKATSSSATEGASEITAFSVSTDKKLINTKALEWSKEVEEIRQISRYGRINEDIDSLQKTIKRIEETPDGELSNKEAILAKFKEKQQALIKEKNELESKLVKNRYRDVNSERLEASRAIAGGIVADKQSKKLGVFDDKGKLQAAAIYSNKKSHIYIEELATSPWNLIDDPRKVKGAGTRAIAQAILENKRSGGKGVVILYPLSDAEPFYAKLGFKPKNNSDEWELSAENAEKLLAKLGLNND